MIRTLNQTSQVGLAPWRQWSPTVRPEQPKDKGNTHRKHSLLFNPAPHTGAGHPHHCAGHIVEGSACPVRSRPLPMQSCHADDPDLVLFLRVTCRTSSWGDHDRTLPSCFLTRPHFGWTLTVPFLPGPNTFPWLTPSLLDKQEDQEHLHCWTWTGAWGNIRE